MYCKECGNEIDDKSKFCSKCGTKIEQDNIVNENKIKIKKNSKGNKILIIILIILIHLILFAGGTRSFLNSATVTADVIYPINTSGFVRFATENIYECNIVYEYKGIEYHDTLTFNDDNVPKEIKNSSTDPNYFDVKLKGYINKNSPDNFIFDMEYYNITKYCFYIQVILIIPSIWLIIRSIIGLVKNRNNSKKGTNKAILILIIFLIVFLIAIIVGSVMFFISKNKNLSNNKDTTPVDWGLAINGNSIILPCSLDKLANAGIKITASDNYYEELMIITNQTFSNYGAIAEGWPQEIYLDLKTGSDISKKEKNVTVSSIDYKISAHSFDVNSGRTPDASSLLTSSQFCVKDNITIGSKSEDVISAFGTDYEPKTETDLNGVFAVIYYQKGSSTLTFGFEHGIVREIKITTTNLNINNKEEIYDLDNSSQDNSLSNIDNNSFNDTTTDIIDTTEGEDIIDTTEREDLIEIASLYEERGYISSKKNEELKKCSDTELKTQVENIVKYVRIQEEYNNQYSQQLHEIFKKEINVELISSEDTQYTYMPSNITQPKAQVEYVSINRNGINAIYYSVEMDLITTDKKQNDKKESTTKKYYKVTNINELDGIIKIDNYNTQANQDEINNIINATIIEPIDTYHTSGLPYYFYITGKYVLYYLPDENRDML